MFYDGAQYLPYYRTLVDITGVLATKLVVADAHTVGFFPNGSCNHSARITHLLTGLEERGGLFKPTKREHAWNYDSLRRLFVDITMSQFGSYPQIAVVPASNQLLRPTRELTQKQAALDLKVDDLIVKIYPGFTGQ